MTDGTCLVAGCDRPGTFARGFCNPHYKRWRRNGDPGAAEIQRRNPGAICAVETCDSLLGKSGAHGYCRKHVYRFRMNGDPMVTRSPGGPKGEANSGWRGDDIAYPAVHRRLRVLRGRAAEFRCVECSRAAHHWAYQHTASDEKFCEKTGNPYTTDLSHYEPMCRACHAQLDSRHGWPHPDYFGRGVSFDKRSGRWRAYATFNRKQYTAGRHDTAEQAAVAANDLRLRLLAGDQLLEDWEKAPA